MYLRLFGSFFDIIFRKSYHEAIPNFEIIMLQTIAITNIEMPITYNLIILTKNNNIDVLGEILYIFI